jgi:hypothetical protein
MVRAIGWPTGAGVSESEKSSFLLSLILVYFLVVAVAVAMKTNSIIRNESATHFVNPEVLIFFAFIFINELQHKWNCECGSPMRLLVRSWCSRSEIRSECVEQQQEPKEVNKMKMNEKKRVVSLFFSLCPPGARRKIQ